MLGPADEWPAGSKEWALTLANQLRYTVKNASDFGVEPIIPLVVQAIDHSPWKVWPEDKSAGSIDRFFQYATGHDYRQIHTLISGYIRDDALARRLAAARGKDESKIGQGARTDLEHHNHVMRFRQGNGSTYLLRRLARDHEKIFKAYENGKYLSVRAAAIDAGIVKKPVKRCPKCGHEW